MIFEPKARLSRKIFEDACKLRKPVIFWAALSFFYVEGDIHLNLVATDNGLGMQTPWGVPIVGVTEEKFLTALAIILGYFLFRLGGLIVLSFVSDVTETVLADHSHECQRQRDIEAGYLDPNWKPSSSDEGEARYRRLDFFYGKTIGYISYLLYYFVPIFLPLSAGGYSFYLLLSKLFVFS